MFGAMAKSRETHLPAGGKKSTHGFTYQLSLLMYTFLRGLRMDDYFSLGAEVEEAGKFDDVVYRYRKEADGKGKRINRLLQQKHKSEQKNITLSSLLSKKSNSDFGLFVYFDSFRDIKGNFIAEDEEIGDLLMYTNGVLKLRDKCDEVVGNEKLTFIMKDTFQEREEIDELFHTKLYCLRKDTEERGKWVKYLMENAKRKDSEERVELAKCLKGKSGRMDRAEREKIEKYLKEKSSRMDMEEKEMFEKYLTEKSSGKDREELTKCLTEKPLGNDTDLENDVDIFLDKLSMAFNQPEIEDLEEMVRKELMVYVNSNVSGAYSQFHTMMHNWLTDKKGFYLDREDGLKLIEDLIGMYGQFKFGVDRPVLNFSGREKELEDLKKAFEVGKKRVVICGLGGVGKTQLARRFAERHTESYSCVIWLKSESYEDLENSFKCLAFHRLGIQEKTANGKVKDIVSILEEVRNALQNRKSFFILDNVQNSFEGSIDGINLNDILMKLPSNSALLMTSRRSDWCTFSKCQLKQLSNNDADILIRKSLKDVTFEDVQNLAEVIQYYPLALQQAIAYINRKAEDAKRRGRVYSIDSYLETFKENYKELLEHPVQDLNEDEYRKTTLTTWNMTMEDIRKDKIRGALSEQILQKISYFFPDGILMSDIMQCFSHEGEEKVESAILLLESYSMLNLLNNDQCSVHRLVQKVTRLRLKENKGEHGVLYSLWVAFRKLTLKKKGEKELLESLLSVCEKLDVRNVVSIWEHCAEHEDLIRKHSDMPKDVICNLINKGRYADGYVYGKRLLQVMETILDPMDESMNEVNFALAMVTQHHGLYNESYEVYKKVWERRCIILGEKHPQTLVTRHQIGSVQFKLGKYLESKEIFESVYECRRITLGEKHPSTLDTRHQIGSVQFDLGNYLESKEIFESVYECERTTLGEEHPSTLTTRNNMGKVKFKLGNYLESKEIFECVYECRRRTLGEEHPSTLTTRNNMGKVKFKLGNYLESKEIFESVYECRRRTLGEEHPSTLTTRNNMGKVKFKLGNYLESKEIFECVYECRRRTLGEEHPSTLTTRNNMGKVKFKLGNYLESKVIFDSVYECRRRTLGEEHPDTLNTREWIELALKKTDVSVT